MEAAFAIGTVVITLGFIAFSFRLARRMSSRMMHGSPEKQAQAKRLMESGSKARATILAIEPTGTILNHINIECLVRFRMDPLDGSASFDGDKTFFINQTRMPRVGDVWPSWYDPSDPATFGVGQPDLSNPDTQRIMAEFGIDNPLTAADEASAATTGPADDAGDDRLDALERLADLRARGLLSDVEFEAEKRRLLDS